MNLKALTVTEIVTRIKSSLEENFAEILIEGEVSNLQPSAAGHYYFSLADENSILQVNLFRGNAIRNPLIKGLKNGDKIVCLGDLSVYLKRGSMNLNCRRLWPAGAGDLKQKFEILKKRLASEGLFDLERKRTIPKFPRRIGIITAAQGAALQDMLHILNRRMRFMHVTVIPSLVQGEDAPKSLLAALEKARTLPNLDVLVLARGGGSMEDLWAFNNEQLAYALAQYPIPTISAVGHQVDFTIADFVADLRAETPSAAAEILSAPQVQLGDRLERIRQMIFSRGQILKETMTRYLQEFAPERIRRLLVEKINDGKRRLLFCRPDQRRRQIFPFEEYSRQVDDLSERLQMAMKNRLKEAKSRLQNNQQLLESLNPSKVLGRGYVYIADEDGKVISSLQSFAKLEHEQAINIVFHDGIGKGKKG